MRKEKSAGAVVFRKEKRRIKYLILHYESGNWDFARGHIEPGEKEQETARREIQEETGIKKPDFISGFRASAKWIFKKKIGQRLYNVHKTAILFLARTPTRKIKVSSEHLGYKWLVYEKALERLTFPQAKKVLYRAQKFLAVKG